MPRAKQQEPAVTSAGTGAVIDEANGAAGTRQAVAETPAAGKRHGTARARTSPVTAAPEHGAAAAVVAEERRSTKRTATSADATGARQGSSSGASAASGAQHARTAKHDKAGARAGSGEHDKAAEHDRRRKPVGRAAKVPATAGVPPAGHEAQVTNESEGHALFFQRQRELLVAERNNYTRQAEELRAQAEALALEHEPGDVQFDEEGGEGGTANVDRELDLHLSAQARAAIDEIDAALAKIEAGTYGDCESCGRPIPEARLEALPHARLCVTCKSGGLTARRQ